LLVLCWRLVWASLGWAYYYGFSTAGMNLDLPATWFYSFPRFLPYQAFHERKRSRVQYEMSIIVVAMSFQTSCSNPAHMLVSCQVV
jgi:hypothetical protein